MEETETAIIPEEEQHPWLEMEDSSVDEVIRFSLDEIRVG